MSYTSQNFHSINVVECSSEEHDECEFPFVSRIEFIRSKLSNFSAHVSGVTELRAGSDSTEMVVSRAAAATLPPGSDAHQPGII